MNRKILQDYFLNNRRVLWWGLAGSLYGFYLVGHNPVSNLCYALRDSYSEAVYRFTLQVIGKLLLSFYIVWLGWQLTLATKKLKKCISWLIFGGLLAYYYNDMVKITIEYVHFIQYCLLLLIVTKALKGRSFWAMLICLLAGFLDEVHQTLEPVTELNWRDIGLNITGVFWGVLLLWTIKNSDEPGEFKTPFFSSVQMLKARFGLLCGIATRD